MINIKKGTGQTLQQSDAIGAYPSASSGYQGIVGGMVCRLALDSTSSVDSIFKGAQASGYSGLIGFALEDDTFGDILESGKLGILLLDGNTVIETDQVAQTITTTTYPTGTPLSARPTGLVDVAAAGDRIIGYVDGIRALPAAQTISGIQIQGSTTVLGIKLAA